MGLNDTPYANRVHVAFFGMRNAGKSSLVNAVTGQATSVVSAVPGTTTDPVKKSMEILPLGPVVIVDTPGIDDEGELGEMRARRARGTLARTDLAVLAVDGGLGLRAQDRALLALFASEKIPFLIAWNKADRPVLPAPAGAVAVSAKSGAGIDALKERIGHAAISEAREGGLFEGLMQKGDLAVLVTPIDASAPKGRLILPQQRALRDALDGDCACLVVQETGLRAALAALNRPPKLVVTDSQAFAPVAQIVPEAIPLTSFSILMARAKGTLKAQLGGVARLATLRDGDRLLMAEGCTHHRQCGDIGTVKIPRWLTAHTGKNLSFETSSGTDFPDDLTPYALVVHCGGCMLNAREMLSRTRAAERQGVPIVNYGVLIAHMRGILPRCLAVPGL